MGTTDLRERGLSDEQLNVAFVNLLSCAISREQITLSGTALKLLARATTGDLYSWLGSMFAILDDELALQGLRSELSFSGFLDLLAESALSETSQDEQNVRDLLDLRPLSHKLDAAHSSTLALMAELGTPPFSMMERMSALDLSQEEISGLERGYIGDLYELDGADQPGLTRLSISRGYGLLLTQPRQEDLQLVSKEMTNGNGTTHNAPVDVPVRLAVINGEAGEAGGPFGEEDAPVIEPSVVGSAHA